MPYYGDYYGDWYGDVRKRTRSRRKRSSGSLKSRARATPKRAKARATPTRRKKRARKPAAARSSSRRRSSATVVRYDPDTLERVTVPKDSIEADEFLTAAQARTDRRTRTRERTKTRKEIQRSVTPIARTAVAHATARTIQLGTAVRGAGAAAGLGVGGTAAAIAAALGVGYAIGTGLRALWKAMTPTERNARKALAFRRARIDLAAKLGRELTPDEVRAMGRGFLQSIGR